MPVSGRPPKRFPGFAARAGELGAAYAVIELALNVGRRGVAAMEDRLLAIEARRGVLGPAHRAFARYEAMGSWAEYDWSAGGEEWTESAAWKDGLIQEILAPGVPKESVVVEIGPGAGRWSAVLRDRVARLILVEPSEAMLAVTRARFEGDPGVSWVLSDGASLPGVEDASVDAVWSFDVFVHLSANDVAGYLGEIARVLRPGGVATVHHAGRRERRARRGPMSALRRAHFTLCRAIPGFRLRPARSSPDDALSAPSGSTVVARRLEPRAAFEAPRPRALHRRGCRPACRA